MEILVVFCTFPSLEKARQIATALVESQLAACVNLCPSVESIYQWEGKTDSATEVLALIKTTAPGYPALEAKIKELHPYDVPEIIAMPITQGSQAYLQWVMNSVSVRS